MRKNTLLLTMMIVLTATSLAFAQQKSYDLQQLLKEKKLITHGQKIVPLTDSGKKGIAMNGLVWLDGVEFTSGTIEVDLRGKNEFQKSFLGIAFHGVDDVTYDLVYFRPFNFTTEDSVRKIHAVQYTSNPDYTWERLRTERNGIYEKGISPAPLATDWFHARIEVKDTEINVYVNNATTPSLTVTKLNDRKTGKIGIFNEGLDGNFANLVIRK
ncbi:MAG: hypothetical protein WKF87_01910 [Chryseolinea sp.]